MTLKELTSYQWFVNMNDRRKEPVKFKVIGPPEYLTGKKELTRLCWDTKKEEYVSKLCSIEVRVIKNPNE